MFREISEIEFAQLLRAELDHKGVETFTEFRVPGTHLVVDLYIPSPPSSIEIKLHFPDKTVAEFLEQMKKRKAVFGPSTFTFLIASREIPPIVQRAIETEWYLVFIPVERESKKLEIEIQRVANTIATSLAGNRHSREQRARLLGILGDHEHFAVNTPEVRMGRYDLLRSLSDYAGGYFYAPNLAADRMAEQKSIYLHTPNLAAEHIAEQTSIILKTFQDLVTLERFEVLYHEVQQLLLEYAVGHFTACALRVGRCLEFIVYSLADEWNVRIDEPTLRVLDDLQRRFRHISSLVLQYRDLRGDDRLETRDRIGKLGASLAGRLSEMLFELDAVATSTPLDYAPPKNVEAILRDIKKTYSRYNQVRDVIDEISELVRHVLDLRNSAAHADPSGKPREVDRDNVEEMIQNVQEILFKLSTIGNTIISAKK